METSVVHVSVVTETERYMVSLCWFFKTNDKGRKLYEKYNENWKQRKQKVFSYNNLHHITSILLLFANRSYGNQEFSHKPSLGSLSRCNYWVQKGNWSM